ncbi:MAG TPA: hypothetical protein VFI72_06355, partial [Candidatus Angelobacter sp.]|nr:hypothetical protein [Candidatus Angelobacter sp.]
MEPSLNASQYPRTYRLSIGWMAFMLLFGLGAVWLGAYTTWQLVFRSHDAHAAAIPAAIFVLVALFGLWLIRAVPKYRMVLYPDRIEVHQLLKPRTLLRDDIQGRRVEEGENSANNVVLVPRDGGREMSIESSFRVDEFFWQWIQALP